MNGRGTEIDWRERERERGERERERERERDSRSFSFVFIYLNPPEVVICFSSDLCSRLSIGKP
jgi:hypothetical protein